MMTVVIESDHVMYLSALNMQSDWFFLVLTTFWQMIHCSLQIKINKKAVLWQGNRTYDAVIKCDIHRNFTAASRGSPIDSTAFLSIFV